MLDYCQWKELEASMGSNCARHQEPIAIVVVEEEQARYVFTEYAPDTARTELAPAVLEDG
jgi:hypothetical protein